MTELADDFREMKKQSQEKREGNRQNSAMYLHQHDIPFTSNNGGAHLIVEGKDSFIDFWPGTGRWITRDGHKGFGVRNLVKYIDS